MPHHSFSMSVERSPPMHSVASYLVVLICALKFTMRLFKYHPQAPVLLPLQGTATFSHGQE